MTNKKPLFIVLSDLHLSETPPICREGEKNWLETQKNYFRTLANIHNKLKCPIIMAGDIFDYWRPSYSFVNFCGEFLPEKVYFICGQHDLQSNNISYYLNSGISALARMKSWVKLGKEPEKTGDAEISGFDYGVPVTATDMTAQYRICVIHKCVWIKEPFPGADISGQARSLMNRLKSFNIIICGDNHIPFMIREENRILINCGSAMRIKADQEKHKPAFYCVYDDFSAETFYFNIKQDRFSRTHITDKMEHDSGIEAFAETLKQQTVSLKLSFEDNLKKYIEKNKVSKETETKIMEAVENGNT